MSTKDLSLVCSEILIQALHATYGEMRTHFGVENGGATFIQCEHCGPSNSSSRNRLFLETNGISSSPDATRLLVVPWVYFQLSTLKGLFFIPSGRRMLIIFMSDQSKFVQ
jgi:hypothetical protein